MYKGVAGNLFAFACHRSFEKGYEGFVAFYAKSKLIEHYTSSLNAVHIGGVQMIISKHAALNLVEKYFKGK
mgnify:CR=1 FL=1